MGNAQILNLEPTPSERTQQEETPDLMEQTRSDVRRIRTQIERQENDHEAHQRHTKILSIILGALIVTLAGASWSVYPLVRGHKKALADIFSLQNVTNTVNEHMNALDASLNKVKADLPALTNRVDKLQASMKTDLQAVRRDMNRSLQRIQSRLSGLESNQKESSDRVTRLQEQVAGL